MYLILVSLLLTQYAQKPQPPPLILVVTCAPAIAKLEMMIQQHPSQQLRTDFMNWAKTKQIESICSSPDQGATITAAIVEGRPSLVIGAAFMLAPDIIGRNPTDEFAHKQLLLYGSYITLRNHLSGVFPMRIYQNLPDPQAAKYIWDVSWRSAMEQWAYAKKAGITRLMMEANANVQKYGETQGLLEGFYQALGNSTPSPSFSRYRPYWDKIYQTEKLRIVKQRSA